MKIVGYTYYQGEHHFTMKCDASLLNQRKPFFVPDWANDFRSIPCLVVRINRLGRGIEKQYADRYYDSVASGIDFVAYDLLTTEWGQATAFDSSLCVGDWQDVNTFSESDRNTIASAIHGISQIVTLRMGDLVYIDFPEQAQKIHIEQEIELNHLYCKIK